MNATKYAAELLNLTTDECQQHAHVCDDCRSYGPIHCAERRELECTCDDDTEPECAGCGRAEGDCSADPCPGVLADRGEVVATR